MNDLFTVLANAGTAHVEMMKENWGVAAVAALVALPLLLLANRALMDREARWFASVVNSTQDELAAGTFSSVVADYARMEEILLDVDTRVGVRRSWITRELAESQLRRLNTAVKALR